MVTPAEDGEPRDRILGRAFGLSGASETDALNKDGDEGEKGREEEEDKEQVEERSDGWREANGWSATEGRGT